MKPILKYPRTPHLLGSRQQRGDEDLAIVSPEELLGAFWWRRKNSTAPTAPSASMTTVS
jgi:hypothetical protein